MNTNNTKIVNGNIVLVLTVNCSGGDQRNDYEWKETHCFTLKNTPDWKEARKKILKPSYVGCHIIASYDYANLRMPFKKMLKEKFGINNTDMFGGIKVYSEPEVNEIDF